MFNKVFLTFTLLLIVSTQNVIAGGVIKWVDENGITHYSDIAPNSDISDYKIVEVPASYSKNIKNNDETVEEENIEDKNIIEQETNSEIQQPSPPEIIFAKKPSSQQNGIGKRDANNSLTRNVRSDRTVDAGVKRKVAEGTRARSIDRGFGNNESRSNRYSSRSSTRQSPSTGSSRAR